HGRLDHRVSLLKTRQGCWTSGEAVIAPRSPWQNACAEREVGGWDRVTCAVAEASKAQMECLACGGHGIQHLRGEDSRAPCPIVSPQAAERCHDARRNHEHSRVRITRGAMANMTATDGELPAYRVRREAQCIQAGAASAPGAKVPWCT